MYSEAAGREVVPTCGPGLTVMLACAVAVELATEVAVTLAVLEEDMLDGAW